MSHHIMRAGDRDGDGQAREPLLTDYPEGPDELDSDEGIKVVTTQLHPSVFV